MLKLLSFFIFYVFLSCPGFAAVNSCEANPDAFEEMKTLNSKLIQEFPSYIAKCKDQHPELRPFLTKVLKDFESRGLYFRCYKESGKAFARVESDPKSPYNIVHWNIAALIEGRVLPVMEGFPHKIGMLNILFHELLHFQDIESQSKFKHNLRGPELFKSKKRFRKIPIPDNHIDSIYLLSSACGLAQDRRLSLEDPVLLNYVFKITEEQKLNYENLCNKSMKKANKNGNLLINKEGREAFCNKFHRNLAERSLAHTLEFKGRTNGDSNFGPMRVSECDLAEDVISCILEKKDLPQIPLNNSDHKILFEQPPVKEPEAAN